MDNAQAVGATFSEEIAKFLVSGLWISLRHPRVLPLFLRLLRGQRRAARLRSRMEKRGVHVPPMLILSVTKRCNLSCKGCYAQVHQTSEGKEMTPDELADALRQAEELGVSIVLIAGGEPLTRPEILDITETFPNIIFAMFTNGLLIDEHVVQRLRRQRHVVPIVSLEGDSPDTDSRRGSGVHEAARGAMKRLGEAGVLFGTSLTVTTGNFDTVLSERFVAGLIKDGCWLVFFIDYVPIEKGTEDLILTTDLIAEEARRLVAYRRDLPALFVAFPGDEDRYGGCLAAGRGFVHLSPEGRVEPCPFSPYSDASLRNQRLEEALKSDLLRAIRENHEILDETNGGCALWEAREWVASLQRHSK
ncbi:MAG: radical SAM protein [Candidatus Bipolaricaulia bacterium]